MSLKVYLIRHGQTEWSISGQHTGRTDLPIIAAGHLELSTCSISTIGFSTHHPEVRVNSGWNSVI